MHGLTTAQSNKAHPHICDRHSEAAAATRKRLEEAARAKEEADREAALARGQRREYKAGRLTAEEKAAKLAEMAGNAAVHGDSRTHRLSHAASKDAAAQGMFGWLLCDASRSGRLQAAQG